MKNTCECGKHTLFFSKKKARYRSDKSHDLCLRCFKKLNNQLISKDKPNAKIVR